MKKILYFLLITILFIPVMVNAAECDTSKVYIDSITIDKDKTKGNVSELEEATAKDKIVNLNLKMSQQNDEILYKVVLKNDSSEDYEINKNSINLNTDYLEYSLESDNNNIVKANSTRTINLRVKYAKSVDPTKYVNGVYQDNITMKVNLRSDDTPANPNTGVSYIIIISLILIISGLSLIIFKRKKLSTLMILVGLILLPIGVSALCTCEIELNSKVTITSVLKFQVEFAGCRQSPREVYEYEYGMTWREYFNSSYYSDLANANPPKYDVVIENNFESGPGRIRFYNNNNCYEGDIGCIFPSEQLSLDSTIIPMDYGYYVVGQYGC